MNYRDIVIAERRTYKATCLACAWASAEHDERQQADADADRHYAFDCRGRVERGYNPFRGQGAFAKRS